MQMTLQNYGYDSPKAEVILIHSEAVLCQSTPVFRLSLEEMEEKDYTFTF